MREARLLEVHTCPLVEDETGRRMPLLEACVDDDRVVGWCNVVVVRIAGETYRLMHSC